MSLLAQFLLRLAFGLAFGMAITSSRRVSSGYFRNHLYVVLGLTTLAALACFSLKQTAFYWAVTAAAGSYIGSVCWLYENSKLGKAALYAATIASLISASSLLYGNVTSKFDTVIQSKYFATVDTSLSAEEANELDARVRQMGFRAGILEQIGNVSSGLVLGLTFAAMLLGHWYLNAPGMELAPLRRLLLAAGAAVALQAVISAISVASEYEFASNLSTQWMLLPALRWFFGLIGVAALLGMTWQTLKIPNTQSATGILYVAVIGVFIGELAASLLSAESAFPL